MRNIKKYLTEEAFAQVENRSGFPMDVVTSIIPGVAYVKENKGVFYNESSTPAPGTFKYYNYISGMTEQQFSLNETVWVPNYQEKVDVCVPAINVPTNKFAEVRSSRVVEDGQWTSWYYEDIYLTDSNNMPGFDTVVVGPDYCWLLVIDFVSMRVVPHRMYSNGETISFTTEPGDGDPGTITTMQIYYESGDTSGRRYYVLKSQEVPLESYKLEWDFVWQGGIFVSDVAEPTPEDLEEVPGILYDFRGREVGTFPLLPTTSALIKNEINETSKMWHQAYVDVDVVDDSTYTLKTAYLLGLPINVNQTVKKGEYYALELSSDPSEPTMGAHNPILGTSKSLMSGIRPEKKSLLSIMKSGEKPTTLSKTLAAPAKPRDLTLGSSGELHGILTKLELDGEPEWVDDSGFWVQAFMPQIADANKLYSYIISKDECGEEIVYPAAPTLSFNKRSLFQEDAFLIYITPESTDMFNPAVTDIDPSWEPDCEGRY